MNKSIDKLVEAQSGEALHSSFNYLDEYVEVPGNMINFKNGKADFGYHLDKEVEDLTITIKTGDDKYKVASLKGETTAGKHYVEWNGMGEHDNEWGEGLYKITVSGREKGEKVGTQLMTTIIDQVKRVNKNSSNKTMLYFEKK